MRRLELQAGRSLNAATSSPPAAHCPAEEESQQPAGEQADPKDHGEKGHHSPAHGLEESRRHEGVGGDQQQMMDQHADSMAGSTVIRGSNRSRANFGKPLNFAVIEIVDDQRDLCRAERRHGVRVAGDESTRPTVGNSKPFDMVKRVPTG